MRFLLATTCLTPLALVSLPLHAQTLVETKRDTAIRTSTIKAGTADDVRITAAGSVVPIGGSAVTIDSANKVTNDGTIQITNANDAVGIRAISGTSGAISNTGKIIIDETYEPTDADKDGDLDGPFAAGSHRFGIRTEGAFAGTIANAGSITIEGQDSAGIALGGPLAGGLSTDGTITVTGDRSTGVRTAAISGPVRLAGTITARGQDATGALIGGDISGALVVQGAITSSGYRSTTLPADVSKLDADDLLQGGPALLIAGNVSGGVILAVPPRDASTTDNDEDKDGIDDAKEGSALVVSYGSAAGLQVGAADRAVTLGPVAGVGTGHGLVIDGGVGGIGVYTGVAANAVVIGGLGGAVSIAGGMTVNGTVQAIALNADATAIRVGSGANVPEIRVAGSVTATGATTAGQTSRGVVVDAGASVTAIRNSGSIKATAGADGAASAIVDRSGGVTLIENSGAIAATGATATSARNVAIDLSANTGGTIVRQTAVASGVTAPSITGDVLFGSGNDTLELADGGLSGTVRFGAGSNRLAMSGDALLTGTTDFGGGAGVLTLAGTSRFTGTLANAQGVAVAVTGGTLDVNGTGLVAIGSLAVGAQGVLGVTIDTATGAATQYQVRGAASFDKGAQLAVKLTGIANAEGRFVILRAGSLTGAENLTSSALSLPFLFKSTLATNAAANEVAIDVQRKTATELGFNRSMTSAYGAVYAALGADTKIAAEVLGIGDGDTLRASLRQMLPDHAGGTFESVTSGSRATARFLSDAGAPFADQGKWGYFIQQAAWGRAKSVGNTASYDINGWGITGGAEIKTGIGNAGLSLGYLHSSNNDGGTDNEVSSDQYELGAYWHGEWDGLRPYARVSAARVGFDGERQFIGLSGSATGGDAALRKSSGNWNGNLVSAAGGISYEGAVGRITFRPIAAIDYYRLTEKGYAETGGGAGFDLTVDRRTSDELAGTASLAVGLALGEPDTGWFHTEIEGGRRQILGGTLGNTTARFAGGQSFTLSPEARTDGWVGRLRASGGNTAFRIGGEFSAEQQQGRAAIALRASILIGL